MNKEILISIKNVYGNETIYPEDETSRYFAEIAGTKTLTPQALNIIKKMGYEIKLKQQAFSVSA